MADNFTAGPYTFRSKEISPGVHLFLNGLEDRAGADALGLVATSPAVNSLLGRLKTIADNVAGATSYKRGANVAPSATALTEASDALYVGGAGNLVVRGANGAEVTFAMDAKSILPFAATHVLAATTATNVVALYLD